MKMYKSFIIVFLSFFLISCSKKELDFRKPEVQVPKQQIVTNKKKGALYARQGTSLFADKKDLQVGDIIQVVISEELTNNSSSKREVDNSSSTSLGGINVTPHATSSGATQRKYASKLNSAFGASLSASSSNDFSGAAKSNINENFETVVSVIIEETYQNGNYYIKGSKEMLIDEQMQEIIISGVIRPYDISPDNAINSTQIANLKILYKKDGEETDVLRVPWLLNLLIKFWPL